MSRESVTFGIEADTRAALDRLANVLGRDRNGLINEAVEAYLDVHSWQIARIERGLGEADAGEFAADAEVASFWKRCR